MARGARFDASFLDDFRKRSAGWGGKIADATSPRRTRTKSKKLLDELAKAAKPSPHREALEELERKPELLKGNQEHYLQVRLFYRLEVHHPEIYKRTFAIPNGGFRAKRTGQSLRAEGQKCGYPDLGCDAPRGIYHGLRMELKHGRNKPTEDQVESLNRLHKDGYCCVVFYELEQAVQYIVDYWNLSAGESMPPQETDSLWLKED